MERTPEQIMEDDIGAAVDEQLARETNPEVLDDAVAEQQSERVVSVERTATRLLVYTSNVSVFEEGSELQRRLLDLSALFSELHVVVLNVASEGVRQQVRLAPSVWIYPTNAKHGLAAFFSGRSIADKELTFAGGFRADIILALDPFISGYTAKTVAAKYKRPLQIHLTTDVTQKSFQQEQKHWWLKSYMMNRVFAARPSVRVYTKSIGKHLARLFPETESVTEVIPKYIDLESVRGVESSGVLEERYPQYKLKLLFVGPITQESGVFEAFSAATTILRYPSVGMFILGEGSARDELKNMITAQNLDEQVVINPPGLDKQALMPEVQVVIMPGGLDAYEEVVLEAAAAGATVVAGANDFVREIFRDDESALLCPPMAVECMRAQLSRLLNENSLRRRLSRVAKQDVFEQVELDPAVYKEAIKNSIERALYSYETPDTEEGVIDDKEMLTAEEK